MNNCSNQTLTSTGPQSQDANNVGMDGAGCMKYSATVYSLFRCSTQHGVAWLSGDWLLRAGERVKQTRGGRYCVHKEGKRFWISKGFYAHFNAQGSENKTLAHSGCHCNGFKKFNYLCGVNKRNRATIKASTIYQASTTWVWLPVIVNRS